MLLFLSLSRVQFPATPWTIARQAPLFMGFPRQECWSGLPFPSPADLPDAGIGLMFPAFSGGFFTAEPPEKPRLDPVLKVKKKKKCYKEHFF